MKKRMRWMLIFTFVVCQVAVLSLFFPTPVYADDCGSDPLNAADCMRTTGVRQVASVAISTLGAAAATLVSVLTSTASTTAETAATSAATSAVAEVGTDAVATSTPVVPPASPQPPPAGPYMPYTGDPNTPEGAIINAAAAQYNAGVYLTNDAQNAPAPAPAPAEPPSAAPEPPPAPPPVADGTPPLQGSLIPNDQGFGLDDLLHTIQTVDQNLPGGPLIPGVVDAVAKTLETGTEIGEQVEKYLPGAVESGWFDALKNAVGTGATLTGTMKEFVDFVDSPEVINNLHDALKAWQNNPTTEGAEEYLKQLSQTTNNKLGKLADGLDLASKGLDVIEAVGKGLSESEKEGFTGVDKALIVGSELGKKGLTWMLTKNPVVGLADWAVGSTTQALWGKDGRVDIGAGIDKAGDSWKDTVKEYAYNTGGGDAADSAFKTADSFLKSLRDIKQKIQSGQITREEGSRRAKILQNTMMGGVQ